MVKATPTQDTHNYLMTHTGTQRETHSQAGGYANSGEGTFQGSGGYGVDWASGGSPNSYVASASLWGSESDCNNDNI